MSSELVNVFVFLKSKLSILEVVSHYTSLKKALALFYGACPFCHQDAKPFMVNPKNEVFYCYGCHKGGDIITFIEKIENCSPLEAAKLLADRYQISLPNTMN